MTNDEIILHQKEERTRIVQDILDSDEPRKIIVAGAGTGKTYTFSQILQLNPSGKNIALTFIRMLRNDMETSLCDYCEVKTFHEFCKGILHRIYGTKFLYPLLPELIGEDAIFFGYARCDYNQLIQSLKVDCEEIRFYLARGNYYDAVSFDDSVYRVLEEVQKNSKIIDNYDQILIDEFQDFNPLEVSFISELEKHGNILIVGDDDQAVYDRRGSSPIYLREIYKSGLYETFELPYCSRCPIAVVEATNSLIVKAQEKGYLTGRIPKRYECFIESKEVENTQFPKVITAQLKTAMTLPKFIEYMISGISEEDIKDSWEPVNTYPTVLIVGARQYLNIINKSFTGIYANLTYKQSSGNEINLIDGYEFLIQDINSNLGWRILIKEFDDKKQIKIMVKQTQDGTALIDLLNIFDSGFVQYHTKIVNLISALKRSPEDNQALNTELSDLTSPETYTMLINKFVVEKKEEEIEQDKTKPSILLTSFQGCKGLSAGFVFIVGANNGVIPNNITEISDVEICQFIVAMTRTRKECYILSNKWMFGAKDKSGNWIPTNTRSVFLDWIDADYLYDLGCISAEDLKE